MDFLLDTSTLLDDTVRPVLDHRGDLRLLHLRGCPPDSYFLFYERHVAKQTWLDDLWTLDVAPETAFA